MGWPSPQGILDNVVAYYLILIFEGVGAVVLMRWLRRFYDLAPPVLVIIGIAAYGMIMLGVNQTVAFLQERTKIVTTKMSNEELADTIQAWLDDFHLRYQKEVREGTSFSFVVQGDDGARIGIARLSKEHQQFITLFCHVLLEPESLTKMKSLPVLTQQWIYDQAAMELLRQNIVITGNLLSGMQLEARVPISELTEGKLMDRLDEIYSALTLVRMKLRSF